MKHIQTKKEEIIYFFPLKLLQEFLKLIFVHIVAEVIPVPGMGDSISEGVIEELVKG